MKIPQKNQKLAMRNNIELKSIKEANLAQRIIAVIIDGALFIFLFVFLTTIVFTPIANKAFKLFRITRLLKILRVFKFMRYSKHFQILFKVLHRESHILWTVFAIALGYIFTTALIMFNVEDSAMFTDFFDALYWSTTTLTTVGYGDIYPATDLGRIISMLSSIFGVAIIALPSGVITASYMEQLKEEKKDSDTTQK